ncbi:MAG: sensor domain-containing diguanylate cyclase [Coriobacteriia bacterium]|nr:sensor domain-containing diguanylate cyclase [Coriobacteriia bacterium]
MSSQQTTRRPCNPSIIHAIAELTRDACLVMDTDAVILEANDEAARLYGYRAEELIGMHVSRLCTEESSRAPCDVPSTARGEGLLAPSTHVRKDGTAFPVEVGWKQSSVGCCELLVAHVRDIGERVRLEAELHLRSDVLDAVLDPIIVHDLEGNLVLANSAAAASAGMTPEEFMLLGPWEWLAEDARSTAPERLTLLLEEGSRVFESQDTSAEGETYPVEVHASVVQLGEDAAVISVVRDITERVKANEAIHRMALSDPLTGLSNRAHFEQALELAIADARRHGDALAVLFLDLDDFKPVNDRLGHAAGDQVLVELARSLKSGLRTTDTVARMGGDEFAVILPRLSEAESIHAAARKVARCAAKPTRISGQDISVTASIGAALFDPRHDDADTLLAKADSAMYAAKREGVVWRVWGEELQATAVLPMRRESAGAA